MTENPGSWESLSHLSFIHNILNREESVFNSFKGNSLDREEN